MSEENNKSKMRFAKAYHHILFNTNLSFGARCTLIYGLDNMKSWKFVSKNAGKKLGASKKLMTGYLNELIEEGHLHRRRIPTGNKRFDYEYNFYAVPVKSGRPFDTLLEKPVPPKENPLPKEDTGSSIPKVVEPVTQIDPYNNTIINKTNINQTNSNKTKEEKSKERLESLWNRFCEKKYSHEDRRRFPDFAYSFEKDKTLTEEDNFELRKRIYEYFYPKK